MDREAILREDAEAYLLQEASRRRFLYRDVEELIETGFLRHTLDIEGLNVTFRSLLPSDVVRFQSRTAHNKTATEVLRWSLASSVWMVDGYELPTDPRENAAYFIYKEWLQNLPDPVIDAFSVVVHGFQNRINRAIRLTEAFCYEPYSRGMWRMLGRPTQDMLNSNSVRRMWVAHNLAEDGVKDEERTWGHTQAVVASMSNKAAKHIKDSLNKLEDREENRRQRVIEDSVNWVINGEDRNSPMTITVNGQEMEVPKIHAAQSTADLEEEMRRVFTGEKDWHDHLVAQYHEGIRKRTLAKREAYQKAIQEARQRALEAEEEFGPRPLVGYTREQLDQLKPDALKPKTTTTVAESAQEQHLFSRYFQGDLKPGVLTTKLTVTDPEQADRPQGEKEAPQGESLQEKISRRRPQLKPDASGG